MKHKGNTVEYTKERNDDIMRAYCELRASSGVIPASQLFKQLVNMPSSRFWVSERRAAVVLSAMFKGEDMPVMMKTRREMFDELKKRVLILKDEHPQASLYELCCYAVQQPAPKFYLTPGSAEVIVCKSRKEWFKRKTQHLRR